MTFSPNDRVRNITPDSRYYGSIGTVIARLPFGFMTPAYDVDYGPDVQGPHGYPFIAQSERDLELIEEVEEGDTTA